MAAVSSYYSICESIATLREKMARAGLLPDTLQTWREFHNAYKRFQKEYGAVAKEIEEWNTSDDFNHWRMKSLWLSIYRKIQQPEGDLKDIQNELEGLSSLEDLNSIK